MGFQAGYSNTTGNVNSFMGYLAGYSNTVGSNNNFMGNQAGFANLSGNNNNFLGSAAGVNSTGSNNTLIGHAMGGGITSGSNNTMIGANVTGLPANLSNNIIIADGSGNRRINVDGAGNVGIGILPLYKLDIQTNADNDGINLRYNNTGFLRIAANSYQLQAYNQITQSGDAGIIFGGATPSTNPFGFVIAPWSNSLNGLRIDKDGNVGIGTFATNGNMLAVKGTAVFLKAIVKAPNTVWPDYVFDSSYNLLPLVGLKHFLTENKHLPDMPTAGTVEKDGIDLGNKQAMLLKKVEELTLYIIELNEKLEALSKQSNVSKEAKR